MTSALNVAAMEQAPVRSVRHAFLFMRMKKSFPTKGTPVSLTSAAENLMTNMTRKVTFTIDSEGYGDVIVEHGEDNKLEIKQGADMIYLSHAAARLVVAAINELLPDA